MPDWNRAVNRTHEARDHFLENWALALSEAEGVSPETYRSKLYVVQAYLKGAPQ